MGQCCSSPPVIDVVLKSSSHGAAMDEATLGNGQHGDHSSAANGGGDGRKRSPRGHCDGVEDGVDITSSSTAIMAAVDQCRGECQRAARRVVCAFAIGGLIAFQ